MYINGFKILAFGIFNVLSTFLNFDFIIHDSRTLCLNGMETASNLPEPKTKKEKKQTASSFSRPCSFVMFKK